jgi:hypothetical protein
MATEIKNRRQCDRCTYGLMVLKEHGNNSSYWQCMSCKQKTFVFPTELKINKADKHGSI